MLDTVKYVSRGELMAETGVCNTTIAKYLHDYGLGNEAIPRERKEEVCFSDENHQNAIELSMKGVGYTAYGGAVDSEWDYQLCHECATILKSYLDSNKSLKDLSEEEE